MSASLSAAEKTAREHRRRVRPGQSARRDFDRTAPRPSVVAQLRTARPPRIPSALNTKRRGYTSPGTKGERKFRRGVGGRPVPIDLEPRAFPVGRGPRKGPPSLANIRAWALPGADLTPTVVFTPSRQVPAAVPGQPRRRDRRPALVAAGKAARRTTPALSQVRL